MRLIMKAVLYVVLMNAVLFVGAVIFGSGFEFNPIYNLVVPVICALASWELSRGRQEKEGLLKQSWL